MRKSEKHNDPTKKKKKGRKSEEEFLPAKKESSLIEKQDIRKTKLLRRVDSSQTSYPSVSQILEERKSEIERERSRMLRLRVPPLRHNKSLHSIDTSPQTSEIDLPGKPRGILKRKKSDILSQRSSREFFIPASRKSSFSEEAEHGALLKKTPAFEEFPTCSSVHETDLELLNATFKRDLPRVKRAIQRGANVNAVKYRLTPLLIATEYADLRLIHYFLKRRHVDINYQDDHGQTALMIAIRHGLDEIAKELIYRGADVDLRDNLGRTALHLALFHEKIHLARLLLAYGADFEIADCFGDRPMYNCVVKRPNLEGLNLLLEHGAVPDYAHSTGINLLSRAIFESTPYEIIEKLITSGADINHRDVFSGKTPLHFAATINNIKIVQLLLEHGADPNSETIYGYSPYDQAIFHGALEAAQFLSEITNDVRWQLLKDLERRKS